MMKNFMEDAVKHKSNPFLRQFQNERVALYFLQKPTAFLLKTHSKTIFDCINSLFQVTERLFQDTEYLFQDME